MVIKSAIFCLPPWSANQIEYDLCRWFTWCVFLWYVTHTCRTKTFNSSIVLLSLWCILLLYCILAHCKTAIDVSFSIEMVTLLRFIRSNRPVQSKGLFTHENNWTIAIICTISISFVLKKNNSSKMGSLLAIIDNYSVSISQWAWLCQASSEVSMNKIADDWTVERTIIASNAVPSFAIVTSIHAIEKSQSSTNRKCKWCTTRDSYTEKKRMRTSEGKGMNHTLPRACIKGLWMWLKGSKC